jgi:hypothetical protein
MAMRYCRKGRKMKRTEYREGKCSVGYFESCFRSSLEGCFHIGEYKLKAKSLRYQTFINKGTECVSCGLKIDFFAFERHLSDKRFHANGYGVKDGEEVLFTKDHIIPKSKGGGDCLYNLQTMCSPCNQDKGNKIGRT